MNALVIGGHGDDADPIAEAKARDGRLAQFFLGDPQSWKGPTVSYAGGAAALKAAAPRRASTCTSTRPTRSTSRRPTTGSASRRASCFSRSLHAAAEVGAKGVIVHGGHVLQRRRP